MASRPGRLRPTHERGDGLAALIGRTALGDRSAFEHLYRASSARLYAVALRMVKDAALAEEIVQDVYVSVWNAAASYDAARSQPLTWLAAITRNRCLDYLRRRELDTVSLTPATDDADPIDLPVDAPTAAELLIAAADARAVRGCIEGLESRQRQAIALAFFQGLSHGELARHLGQPLGTVKSWVRRGLERLKSCLDAAGTTR